MQYVEYECLTALSWIRDTIETPQLDVSAKIGDNRQVNIAVVNIHKNKDFEIRLEGVGFVDIQVFWIIGLNVRVVNAEGWDKIGI